MISGGEYIMNVLVINGPNLNMLGYRNPEIYGYTSYHNLEDLIRGYASDRQPGY